jgi:hypothetical protein
MVLLFLNDFPLLDGVRVLDFLPRRPLSPVSQVSRT